MLHWKKAEESAKQKIEELLSLVDSFPPIIQELKQKYNKFHENVDEKEKQELFLSFNILEAILFNSRRIKYLTNQKTYDNELIERELHSLKSEYRKRTQPYENDLSKEMLNILIKYGNVLYTAIERADALKHKLMQSSQFSTKLTIGKYKKLNLTITYGTSAKQSRDVASIIQKLKEKAEESNKDDERLIDETNINIVVACKEVFNSPIVERMLGKSFNLKIQIYVADTPDASGVFGLVHKLFMKRRKIISLDFLPGSNEVIITLGIGNVLKDNREEIAKTIIHEFTHAFDWKVREEMKSKLGERFSKPHIILLDTRAEAPTTFTELVYNPSLKEAENVVRYLTILQSEPVNDFDELYKISEKFKKESSSSPAYDLGLTMMVQLFLVFIGKEKDDQNSETIVSHLKEYQSKAITLLNLVKLMDYKKFFDYYMKRVSKPIFAREFLSNIQKFAPEIKIERKI